MGFASVVRWTLRQAPPPGLFQGMVVVPDRFHSADGFIKPVTEVIDVREPLRFKAASRCAWMHKCRERRDAQKRPEAAFAVVFLIRIPCDGFI